MITPKEKQRKNIEDARRKLQSEAVSPLSIKYIILCFELSYNLGKLEQAYESYKRIK